MFLLPLYFGKCIKINFLRFIYGLINQYNFVNQGPVVQSIVSLTSSLRVISLTVLADSIYNILIFFAEKNVSSFCTTQIVFSKKFQHICVSLDVNFNEWLTNDVVSFEQLRPEYILCCLHTLLFVSCIL